MTFTARILSFRSLPSYSTLGRHCSYQRMSDWPQCMSEYSAPVACAWIGRVFHQQRGTKWPYRLALQGVFEAMDKCVRLEGLAEKADRATCKGPSF